MSQNKSNNNPVGSNIQRSDKSSNQSNQIANFDIS